MDSSPTEVQVPLTEVLAELQSMGLVSERDLQLAAARVGQRMMALELRELRGRVGEG